MADETPKLIQIGKGGPGIKKDGFNLISEKVVKVDVENQTLEIELLAYEGKTVMLEVGEDLVEELKKIKPGDGVTVRVVEEEPGGTPGVPAVASLLTHEDDDLRQVASEIIRKIGKPAVEPLTEVMLTADETLQARIRKLLDRMGYKPKPKTEVM